ncbi:MAG: endolytic transglycosylase MltG [Xanthomonadaceae bacterium]|nr:endolytic transglycosylase MltG [Xanthomonadaceae bacterium]
MTASPARLLRRVLMIGVLLVAAAAAVVGAEMWRQYQSFADRPLASVNGERVLEVKRGDGFLTVLRRMRRIEIADGHDWQWRLLAFELKVLDRLQVGEYAVGHGITPRQLLRKLEAGDVIQHRFTVVEGWNLRDLRAALAREPALAQTLSALDDAALMAAIGRPNTHAEGRFLPETYQFTRGVRDVELLRRAALAMDVALAEAWVGRDDGLPLETPEQALILASIVEKETGIASERPQIAGVFVRRLRIGMRLQTDPTVIYGLGAGFDGNLRRSDLLTDTPYNTYTRAGLPPTPIALPGRDALRAAVHPAPGDALYFVARGDGSHHFSATLAEHNRAVARYQLRRR